MAAMTKAGWPKLTAKDRWPQQWAVLAVAIFIGDEDQKEAFKENPVRFANSVNTHMQRWVVQFCGLSVFNQ
jgi:hypothetical protein